MPDGGDADTVRVLSSIEAVDAPSWNACAGAGNPFLAHEFLEALEASGSVGDGTGWRPCHVTMADPAGRLVAAAPAYLKSHSQGEYVFDHGWAAALEQAGRTYYPKLLVAVPFTPVPGPRLLTRPGPRAQADRLGLAQGLVALAERVEVSSLHVNFIGEADAALLESMGFLIRLGYQFHWMNGGYACFDDFLQALSSRKRKGIRKERQAVAGAVTVHRLTGQAIEPRHWDAFYHCYVATGGQKWGSPYLTRDFFHRLGAAMAERVLLVMAEHEGRFVAGALNLIGEDALYGRHWGCLDEYRFLHFEACYYQAIEFAIERGLPRVEAGVQGEHKIRRGYLPVATRSAHWIRDADFKAAIGDFLRREGPAIEHEINVLAGFSPFRKTDEART